MLPWRSYKNGFANPYSQDSEKLTSNANKQVEFYRPVFYGLATREEVRLMTPAHLSEINEIAYQLMDEKNDILSTKIANNIITALAPALGIEIKE